MKKILLIGAVLLTALSYSQNLDATFGTNGGIVVSQVSTSNSNDLIAAAAQQADGKMVYVGRSGTFSSVSFISRTTATGALDTSFNSYGFRYISGAGFEAVAIQPDGKILAVGNSTIYRFNADGSLDTSFDGDGFASIVSGGYAPYLKSIVLQADGKIVLGGFVSNGTNNDFIVARLTTSGALDTLFDFDGIATLAVGTGNDEALMVALQPDGKIVLAGQTNAGTNNDFALARFNSVGALDASFGVNGSVVTAFGATSNDLGRAIDIQSDGKIVMVGTSSNKLALARYNTNGTLDTAFDTDGMLLTTTALTVSTNLTVFSTTKANVKCLSTGKTLVSGSSNNDFALFQFNSNGTSDAAFGTNGTALYNIDSSDRMSFLMVRTDGKIVSGGSSMDLSTSNNQRGMQIQFSSTGVFESMNSISLKQGADQALGVIQQGDYKTVVLARSKNGAGYTNTLMRYNTNGTLDTTFGVNGVVDLGVSIFNKIVQQPDGRILLLGGTDLFCVDQNGNMDVTFGNNGTLDLWAASNGLVSFIDAVKIGINNEIYVAFDYDSSVATDGSLFDFGLLRLNVDGTLDTNFGTSGNGLVNTRFDFYSPAEMNFPTDLHIQSDGKIILTGPLYIPLNGSYAATTTFTGGVVRYNTDGTLDTSFGTNGKVTTQIGTYNHPMGIVGTPDNKFIINSRKSTSGLYNLTSYNGDGTVDTSFGISGFAADQTGQVYNKMVLLDDGKIIKGGVSNGHFSMNRYNTNGTLDTSFGTGGVLTTPIYYNSSITDLNVLRDGKLLAVGSSFNGSGDVLAQARYTNVTLGTLDFTSNDTTMMVYPNPIKVDATFEYTLNNNENISIDIVDLQGKVVKSIVKNASQTAGTYKQNINLSNGFSAGNYFLRFSTAAGSQSVKIVKID